MLKICVICNDHKDINMFVQELTDVLDQDSRIRYKTKKDFHDLGFVNGRLCFMKICKMVDGEDIVKINFIKYDYAFDGRLRNNVYIFGYGAGANLNYGTLTNEFNKNHIKEFIRSSPLLYTIRNYIKLQKLEASTIKPQKLKASTVKLQKLEAITYDRCSLYPSAETVKYCEADVVLCDEMHMYNEVVSKLSTKIDLKRNIKNVLFKDPATIVFWNDGTKTVVKADNEPYDPEKGLAMAISKKVLGNNGSYYKEFKKWLPKEEENK